MMDDLISRQDAIDVASRECHEWRGIFSDIEQGLKELPSIQPDIDEFLRNKSPKEHREILHWIAIHYYPRDSKEVLQAVSNMIRPDTNGGSDD